MSHARQPDHEIDPQFLRRWSPRAFTGEAIPEATLLRFLEAARWAPSGFNAQPWRFVWARRDTPAWAPLLDTLSSYNRDWAARASALVLVASQSRFTPPGASAPQDSSTHAFDAGAAWAQLALQASLEGWHAHAVGGFDHAAARTALAVPADFQTQVVLVIGRRADPSVLPEKLQAREQPSTRLPLAELAAEGRFPGVG